MLDINSDTAQKQNKHAFTFCISLAFKSLKHSLPRKETFEVLLSGISVGAVYQKVNKDVSSSGKGIPN